METSFSKELESQPYPLSEPGASCYSVTSMSACRQQLQLLLYVSTIGNRFRRRNRARSPELIVNQDGSRQLIGLGDSTLSRQVTPTPPSPPATPQQYKCNEDLGPGLGMNQLDAGHIDGVMDHEEEIQPDQQFGI